MRKTILATNARRVSRKTYDTEGQRIGVVATRVPEAVVMKTASGHIKEDNEKTIIVC